MLIRLSGIGFDCEGFLRSEYEGNVEFWRCCGEEGLKEACVRRPAENEIQARFRFKQRCCWMGCLPGPCNGEGGGGGGGTASGVTQEILSFVRKYWLYIIIGILVLAVLKRR